MRWYWILLIVIGSLVIIGAIINAINSKKKDPLKTRFETGDVPTQGQFGFSQTSFNDRLRYFRPLNTPPILR